MVTDSRVEAPIMSLEKSRESREERETGRAEAFNL